MTKWLILGLIFQSVFAYDSLCLNALRPEHINKIRFFRKKFSGSSVGGRYGADGRRTDFHASMSASKSYGTSLNQNTLDIEISETFNPISKMKKSQLSFQSEQYNLIETGERLSLADINVIDDKVLRGFDPDTHELIDIVYTGEKLKLIDMTKKQQKIIHEKVIDLYVERKGHYLKETDIQSLKNIDNDFPNQSVFALTKPGSKSIIEMTDDELKESISATLSVVYKPQSLYVPSFLFDETKTANYYLPLSHRLHPIEPKEIAKRMKEGIQKAIDEKAFPNSDIEDSFRKIMEDMDLDPPGFNYSSSLTNTGKKLGDAIVSKFGKDKTFAEFIRFAKFDDVSDEMFSEMILKALKQTEQNGVDVIMLSADSLTQRLFKRQYRFQTFVEIEAKRVPNIHGEEILEHEYIMYLETDSKEFKQLVNELEEKTSLIRKSEISF